MKITRIREVDDSVWIVEEADTSIEIKTENGGTVASGDSAPGQGGKRQHSILELSFLIVILTVSIGFLIVVVGDVIAGTISLSLYIKCTLTFLAGLGIGKIAKK